MNIHNLKPSGCVKTVPQFARSRKFYNSRNNGVLLYFIFCYFLLLKPCFIVPIIVKLLCLTVIYQYKLLLIYHNKTGRISTKQNFEAYWQRTNFPSHKVRGFSCSTERILTSLQGVGVRPFAHRDCGFEFRGCHECLCCVFYQVEVSASGWSFVKRCRIDCSVIVIVKSR